MVLYGVLRPPREQVGDLAPAVAHSPLRLEDDSVLARHPVALQKEREVQCWLYGVTVLRCYGVRRQVSAVINGDYVYFSSAQSTSTRAFTYFATGTTRINDC